MIKIKVDQQSSIQKLPFFKQHRLMSLRRFIHSRNSSWSDEVRQWILVTVLPAGRGEMGVGLDEEMVFASLLQFQDSFSRKSTCVKFYFISTYSLKFTIGSKITSSMRPLLFACYSQYLQRQSSMSAISCLDLLILLCFSKSRVYLFLSAFSVRPSKQQTISDHFLLPLLFLMRVRSCMSSEASQGPFLSRGFRKQFQCYLHCLELLKTFPGDVLRKQSSSETVFQLRWVKFSTLWLPCCWSMMFLSNWLSSVAQLQLERLVLRMLSHLNMQLLPLTPGINLAILSQSSRASYLSTLSMLCLSQYLEMTHTRIFTSSSLQFFFNFLFFTILSMRPETSLTMVSSLMQEDITFLFLFTCSQCCRISSRISLLRCSCRSSMKASSLYLAQCSPAVLERDQTVLGAASERDSWIYDWECSQRFS